MWGGLPSSQGVPAPVVCPVCLAVWLLARPAECCCLVARPLALLRLAAVFCCSPSPGALYALLAGFWPAGGVWARESARGARIDSVSGAWCVRRVAALPVFSLGAWFIWRAFWGKKRGGGFGVGCRAVDGGVLSLFAA